MGLGSEKIFTRRLATCESFEQRYDRATFQEKDRFMLTALEVQNILHNHLDELRRDFALDRIGVFGGNLSPE